MAKSNDNQWSEPVTKADLNALKAEIIEAVQDTVEELATRDTVNAIMETVAETKEGMTKLTGLMQDMHEELTATHADVRHIRNTTEMLVKSDAAHETAIASLRKRLERVERKVGITK
jgi:predicted  nucleic acid-binding Zn-ribbon protein